MFQFRASLSSISWCQSSVEKLPLYEVANLLFLVTEFVTNPTLLICIHKNWETMKINNLTVVTFELYNIITKQTLQATIAEQLFHKTHKLQLQRQLANTHKY